MSFANDAPLFDPRKDLLGFAPFARRLSRVVRASQSTDNIVIGLNGAWGSGKTTVVNFALANLIATEKVGLPPLNKDQVKEEDALVRLFETEKIASIRDLERVEKEHGTRRDETVILRYNPWLVSGHETLISDFFRILGERASEFAADDAKGDIRNAAGEVAALTERLAGGGEGLMRVVALGLDLAGGSGAASATLTGAKQVFKEIKGSAKSIREKLAERAALTLQDARKKLKSALERTGKRYLVVIDDTDRLEASEVRPLLSMVKSVGDLPNVTYLLGFDRARIEAALNEPTSPESEAPTFLEKIVQVDIDLPRASANGLRLALLQSLPTLLDRNLTQEEKADIEKDLFYGAALFEKPRDLMKLMNGLRVVRMATDRELLITDVIRMELIRLKERKLFDWIMRYRGVVSGDYGAPSPWLTDNERKKFFDEGLENASEHRRAACLRWLRRTLPQFREKNQAFFDGPKAKQGAIGWPLCRPEGWIAYTQLYPHEDSLTQDEWDRIHTVQEDETECAKLIESLSERLRSDNKSMLFSLIDDLDRFVTGQPKPIGLIAALLKADKDTWWHLNYGWGPTPATALKHLMSLVPQNERVELLKTLLSSPEVPLSTAGFLVLELGRAHNFVWVDDNEDEALLAEGEVLELADIVAARMDVEPVDVIGWGCRVALLFHLYKNRRDTQQAAKLAKRTLESGGKGGLGIILMLSSYVTSADGSRFEFRRRPENDLFPLEALRKYAEAHMRTGQSRQYQELLESCLNGIDRMLSNEEPAENGDTS